MEPTNHNHSEMEPAGWYHAEGDPVDTVRYWNGSEWIGGPVAEPTGDQSASLLFDQELASVGQRIGGRLIDVVLLTVLLLLYVGIRFGEPLSAWWAEAQAAAELGRPVPQPDIETGGFDTLIIVFFGFAWDALWTAFAGGTPGKLLVGTRVADAKAATWKRATLFEAALRATNRLVPLLALISFSLLQLQNLMTLGIGIVSLIMLFTDPMRRTVMDYVGSTIVVRSDVLGLARSGMAADSDTDVS